MVNKVGFWEWLDEPNMGWQGWVLVDPSDGRQIAAVECQEVIRAEGRTVRWVPFGPNGLRLNAGYILPHRARAHVERHMGIGPQPKSLGTGRRD